MKLKLNYLVIPLIVFGVGALGSYFTSQSVTSWYLTLSLPSIAPPGQVIGIVWTVLYVLIALSVILFWNKKENDAKAKKITAVFAVNGFLNAFWSYSFFGLKQIGFAVFVCTLLGLSVFYLIYLLWHMNRKSAYLLIPYAAWVTFATYLNYLIYTLNR